MGDVDVGTWSSRGAWRRPLGWFLIWGGSFSGGCDLWVGEALLEMDVAGSVWWAGTGRLLCPARTCVNQSIHCHGVKTCQHQSSRPRAQFVPRAHLRQ